MTPAADSAGNPWLVVSDVDDTLTGDVEALADLHEQLKRHRHTVRFALNSSRPFESVRRTLAEAFPRGFEPDAIITAMGTEIRVAGYILDAWTDRFRDWPRDRIFEVVAGLGYRPHKQEYQTRYKASFAVKRGKQQKEVASRLSQEGLQCRIVASGKDDLDIIPQAAGKDSASIYLGHFLGISEKRLIVAGDSRNDLDMFRIAFRAIAVGNARTELLEAMPADTSYHAAGHHAAGVLEGLRHFGIIP